MRKHKVDLYYIRHTEIAQVIEIRVHGRQSSTYATQSIPRLLMPWRRKEPGHQQPWYWISLAWSFGVSTSGGSHNGTHNGSLFVQCPRSLEKHAWMIRTSNSTIADSLHRDSVIHWWNIYGWAITGHLDVWHVVSCCSSRPGPIRCHGSRQRH